MIWMLLCKSLKSQIRVATATANMEARALTDQNAAPDSTITSFMLTITDIERALEA